ncbi:haloacid dehalogenase [Apiospora hydei]|uniref:Haloacid dehalogenase n=1 Tax=Apiospora hydei TaxID=1337664 RepID=A0ABR1XE41_9PEZI
MAKAKPNLLLCFDAFGTLFKPKHTVALQYAEVARQCGFTGFTDGELQSTLKTAIKDESKKNPNYGKATGLGATKWWTNLLHRFASKEGYDVEPGLVSTLRALKQPSSERRFDKIVVGVVTNSDDRVPSILSSFGLNVSPLRYGGKQQIDDAGVLARPDYDIDFHCMSYDVGVEKPDRRIFESAEHMLAQIVAARDDGKSMAEAGADVEGWQKVYVGDEHAKDVVGAMNAGWDPVLLDVDGDSDAASKLTESHGQTLADSFKERPVLTVSSIRELIMWLTGKV